MYRIFFDQKVKDEDFKNVSKSERSKILTAIYKKLSIDPIRYGKPLKGKLKGLYRVRINFYRAIYRVYKQEVIVKVIKIGLRKDSFVYKEVLKRT